MVVLLDDVARGITVVSFDELFGASSSAEFEPELLQPRRDRFRRRVPICRVLVRWIGLPLMSRLGRFRWPSRTCRGHLRRGPSSMASSGVSGFFSLLELIVGAS